MDIINTLTEKSLAKYFDHTFLKAYATRADFEKLCKEARELGTAMVAINSAQVRVCKELLKGCDVHVGCCNFLPAGTDCFGNQGGGNKKSNTGWS